MVKNSLINYMERDILELNAARRLTIAGGITKIAKPGEYNNLQCPLIASLSVKR